MAGLRLRSISSRSRPRPRPISCRPTSAAIWSAPQTCACATRANSNRSCGSGWPQHGLGDGRAAARFRQSIDILLGKKQIYFQQPHIVFLSRAAANPVLRPGSVSLARQGRSRDRRYPRRTGRGAEARLRIQAVRRARPRKTPQGAGGNDREPGLERFLSMEIWRDRARERRAVPAYDAGHGRRSARRRQAIARHRSSSRCFAPVPEFRRTRVSSTRV